MQAMETRLVERMAQTEAKIVAITEQNESYATRLTEPETQMTIMMDLLRKTASEQAKATQSWANVAARAITAPTATPSPPASFPSVTSSSLNPHSSISHNSDGSQPMIIVDLSNTPERSNDIPQLKTIATEALKKHEATRGVRCTGVQKRGGGEHRIKCIFESEEHARLARAHPAWLQESRFGGARILGEEWYPVKVDRVDKGSICVGDTRPVTESATQRIAEENSKASNKEYGSVLVFLANRPEADGLLRSGCMDFGGEMAYVRPYE
ncbi:hypothetical protein LTR70_010418 [Exophiala xenobiotica]|uniref:Uncharacterized protein n=1 Tax=Lithohypha guttulata TaxID=1690604 RepID=A0ABR0JUB7_9EURO|nr:hypothetical protein LTR24_010392 [Lithohypha guttulata]KAK5309290.1 hypothetical protein LTR70_010418 [Exophiala xenobiotica]